jgi:hypothetical protein
LPQVAKRCGFSDEDQMRIAFFPPGRHFTGAYRSRFAAKRAASPQTIPSGYFANLNFGDSKVCAFRWATVPRTARRTSQSPDFIVGWIVVGVRSSANSSIDQSPRMGGITWPTHNK